MNDVRKMKTTTKNGLCLNPWKTKVAMFHLNNQQASRQLNVYIEASGSKESSTSWGANGNTLRTAVLSLCHSRKPNSILSFFLVRVDDFVVPQR